MGAQLRVYTQRIKSAQTTKKITKAMELIAASRIQKALARVEASSPYARAVTRAVSAVATHSNVGHPLTTERDTIRRSAVIVLTSDRGLAGAFNSNIVKAARDKAHELRAAGKTVRFLLVGKKGRPVINRLFADTTRATYDTAGVREVGFDQAQEIAREVLDLYDAGEFDVAHLFFSKFRSALVQEATAQQIIPVALPATGAAAATSGGAVVEYEPDEEAILADLLPRNVTIQIFKGLLENAASEQGASMTAMDNATRNAGDLINRLTIQYNRSRQAAITKELIEIISGAEAL